HSALLSSTPIKSAKSPQKVEQQTLLSLSPLFLSQFTLRRSISSAQLSTSSAQLNSASAQHQRDSAQLQLSCCPTSIRSTGGSTQLSTRLDTCPASAHPNPNQPGSVQQGCWYTFSRQVEIPLLAFDGIGDRALQNDTLLLINQ